MFTNKKAPGYGAEFFNSFINKGSGELSFCQNLMNFIHL
jgi:hypothetical protein